MTSAGCKPNAGSGRPEDYLENLHRDQGVGRWRNLYLELMSTPELADCRSIIEIGAGGPSFLTSMSMDRRMAVDVSDKYKAAFESENVELAIRNMENEDLSGLGRFDVAVCSDVFEHLLHPERALHAIKEALEVEGLLFSHVPNEYRIKRTLRVMLGLQEDLYFHRNATEWTDPHLRRFTDIGYRRFLEQEFQYNIKITPLRYSGFAKVLRRARLKVPFCLEGGPTYVSTNSATRHGMILKAIAGC